MKKYFSLYKTLLLLNWYALIEYRADFVSRIISGFVFSSYHVITVLLITNNVSSVFGWTRNELLLLAATYSVFIGIFHTFISRNISKIADDVYFGKLDFLLLKPLDKQLITLIWTIDYISLFRVMYGLLLTGYMLMIMHIIITVPIILLYIVVTIVGISILYAIWLSLVSITIFFPRASNIVVLLFNMSNIARYPQEMYAKLPIFVGVLLLPLALVMTTPTKVLVSKFTLPLGMEMIGLCLLFGIAARAIWFWSLKHYTSASS